ncbi:YraN family protein [Paenibacillus sp.]|uniref:YraN family protein n=1 Tax=Paenibacillus sp. TaxID=58172 RepID=UPI002D72651F|nr:YraN family protein [Paenibacillus sp.]HZG57907.1 YraN family protein [Paenibacillus sp.]
MNGDRRKAIGAAGEAAAAAYLAGQGYKVVAANWRCRFGELDLVAAKDGTLAFVEVRTRSSRSLGRFGAPLESVTPGKQAKLRRLAEAYLQREKPRPDRIRFDCVGVVLGENGAPLSVDHLEDAF